jgi:hypothetical protein
MTIIENNFTKDLEQKWLFWKIKDLTKAPVMHTNVIAIVLVSSWTRKIVFSKK